MDESILLTIKQLLGVTSEYGPFDSNIIHCINTALMALSQMGMTKFKITGAGECWSDYLGDVNNLESVKTYIHMQVQMMFDTPTSSNVMSMLKDKSQEIEWRLIAEMESEGE